MPGRTARSRRAAARVTMCACLAAALAPGVHAGEVPGSAPSRSWGLAPILVDSPALLCLFPQRAVADSAGAFGAAPGGSILWATTDADLYDSDDRSVGALGRWRSVGFFALAQPNYLVGGDLAGTGEPVPGVAFLSSVYHSSSSILQAGAGTRWGAVRAGLAFRATRHRYESGSGRVSPDGSSNLSGSQNELDFRELAFGLGAEVRGATVDAVLEWQDESYEEAYGEDYSGVQAAVTLRGDTRGTSGVALRADVPVGSRLRVVTAGSYHWAERTWTGTRYQVTGLQDIRFGERVETWGAHAGLVGTTRLVERLVLAGSFVRYDEPLSGLRNDAVTRTTQEISSAVVTVAAEKSIWRTLVLRAGVSGCWSKSEATAETGDPERFETQTMVLEQLTDRFHWGLAYRWRGFRFETALRAPPVLDDPFENFDLSWSF